MIHFEPSVRLKKNERKEKTDKQKKNNFLEWYHSHKSKYYNVMYCYFRVPCFPIISIFRSWEGNYYVDKIPNQGCALRKIKGNLML